MKPVYITRVASFFPNDPISNDQMEEYLGKVGGKPSKARSIVLRNNGIKTRYYSLNKEGQITHTNAQLAANAIQKLFDQNHKAEDVEILGVGTSSPDQTVPSHAAMVHGALGVNKNMELISPQGTCATGIQSLKYAYLAIRAGEVTNAVAAGSERFSPWMHASRFEQEAESLGQLEANPYLAFEKDFLRWMLSDGAAAAYLQDHPNEDGSLSFRIEFIEMKSYANELPTCMYSGGIKDDDGNLISWMNLSAQEIAAQSAFALKQDTKLLAGNIVPRGGIFLEEVLAKHQISAADIDHWLPHMSSEFFKKEIIEYHKKIGFELSEDKWFYNLTSIGNIGAASPFAMLDELQKSNRAKKGDHVLIMVPESARFTYGYIYLTVV